MEAGGGKRGKAREGGKEGGGRPGPPPSPVPVPEGSREATDNANARAAVSALMIATTSGASRRVSHYEVVANNFRIKNSYKLTFLY